MLPPIAFEAGSSGEVGGEEKKRKRDKSERKWEI